MWDDDAELRALFHDEVSERTHRLVEGGRAMTTGPLDAERLVSLVRDAHTVKGSSGVMGFGALARGAEALEEVWKGLHEGAITSVPELGEALARVAASLKEASDSHQTEGTPELTDAVEDLRALLASASGQRAWRETGQEAVPRPVAPVPPSPSSDRAPPQSASHSPDLGGLLSTLQAEVVEEAASIESTRLYRLINRSAEVGVDARALRETVSALRMAAASSPREVASLAFRWEQAVEALEQTVEDLQRQAMALAATPLSEITDAFPRLLRYLARKTDKHVRLTLVGDEVEADRQVLERLAEPLRHLVVNAIEHGIEAPGEREKARKPSTGEVSVRAKVLEGRLSIVVEDDGRGVDWALVEDRGKGRGLLDQDSRPSEEELSSLLFREGFSTSLAKTEFSGDGTGLARLAEAVEALNGGLHLRSFPGRGTRLELTVPAWWALQDALLVRAGGHQWGIPAPAVAEAFPLSLADIRPG
ncbi:MAG: ATP-binding protein, partial [Actinomycetota bacterium]|nr:ATP-binding protein [Actinomycetota bacterium]